MSCPLPPELLDIIVDHLHDESAALKACCLVSKSWIPRTRIHLFAHVSFHSSRPFESWMKAFPDPFNSPAHYTRILHLSRFNVATVAIPDVHPWVHSFNNVVDLRVATLGLDDHYVPLTQLRGLSPILKSLSLSYSFAPLSDSLNFICSFPLLEDLALSSLTTERNTDEWVAPPTSPKFTGFFLLNGDNRYITRKLLDLPGGLRFSEITVSCAFSDGGLIKELVSTCSNTLESLGINFYQVANVHGIPPSVNLSKAAKLKYVEFQQYEADIRWINATLKTAKSENLQKISIHFSTVLLLTNLVDPIDETICLEWQELDHLLVNLWTTRSVCLELTYEKRGGGIGLGVPVPKLLPELTRRGF